MKDSAVTLLKTCADSSDADLWSLFDAQVRPRLAAGVTRALWRSTQRADRELIAELIQETYCRLLANDRKVLRAFRGTTDGEAIAYLVRVAESVTLDRLRASAAAKRGSDLVVAELSTAAEVAHQAPDPAVSPEDRVLRRDLWRLFWSRCRALIGSRDAERDLAIVELAIFQGWTSREIARARGLPASTVDTIIHRVRRRLARRGVHLPHRDGTAREIAESDAPNDAWNL